MSTEPSPLPCVVTPGNHDGVHLGHRALIDAARERAQSEGHRTVALCFDPHPTTILAPERSPVLLTQMGRRVQILRGAGCDEVIVLPFDADFANTSPQVFVQEVLVGVCNAKGVVIGPDFHFGRARSGNVDTLRALGGDAGFGVEVVDPVMFNGAPVSSTRIRRALAQDRDVRDVAQMLTRVHDVVGRVIQGDQRGRKIGFPTANLDVEPVQLPSDGVYAVAARAQGTDNAPLLFGVANLGVRPTFAAGRAVEVHLFDFEGDLYGTQMRVGFISRIRGEKRFDQVAQLKAQIASDSEQARKDAAEVDQELLRWM